MTNRIATLVLAAMSTLLLSSAPAADGTGLPAGNPFAAPSPLPFNYPQFDRIRDSDFAPAFDAGMAEELAEVRRIADNPAPPTFENTMVALQRSGQLLRRARDVFDNLFSADTNDARNKLRADYAPRFAAHADAIRLDAALFARIQALHDRRAQLGLDPESLRLLERYYADLVHVGAKLSAADKEKLKGYNAELAALTAQFSQNMQDEVNDSAVVVDDVKQLDGLSPAQIAAAAEEAKARGLAGKYVLTLLNTTGQPPESQLTYRPLRQRTPEGGINPAAVRYFAEVQGGYGKVVWMPTHDSENEVTYLRQSRPHVRVSVNGVLLPEVLQVLDLIAQYRLTLATGHVTSREMLMIVAEAKQRGVDRIIITHPNLGPQYTSPTLEQLKEAVAAGAYAEIVAGELGSRDSESFMNMIRTLGPAHCILSTDSGLVGTPNHADALAIAAGRLRKAGFSEADLDLMFRKNPAKVLGLPPP